MGRGRHHPIPHAPHSDREPDFHRIWSRGLLRVNCRFLLAKDNWQGYVIDGSETNIARLQASYFYWQRPLTAKAAFIDAENVAQLLDESGFDKDLGILSVDVDGVDYFLLERLVEWRARIIIVEYNALFGSERAVTIPYDASFTRSKAHSSNLYFGASLRAFERLLSGRGYALVGVNSVGSTHFSCAAICSTQE